MINLIKKYNLSKKLNEIISWSTLAALENNKFVQRALIFLFIIPMVAKFLSKVNNPIKLTINDYLLTLEVSLPFSWIAFYFSALAFTVSIVFYKFFAPKIIREYSDLGSKVNEGKIWTNLVGYLHDLAITDEYLEQHGLNRNDFVGKMAFVTASDKLIHQKKYSPEKAQRVLERADILVSFYNQLTDKGEEDAPKKDWDKRQESFIRSQFWTIYHYANKTRLWARIICSIFYLVGFGLIVFVLAQNMIYVINFTQ